MKLRELIDRLDRTDANKTHFDAQAFASDAGVPVYVYSDDLEKHGFSAYYVSKWMCTDTFVGNTAIFLNGSFVCLSTQQARKEPVEHHWASSEARRLVARVLVEVLLEQDAAENRANLLDLDEDMGDGYKCNYGAELLADTAVFDETQETVRIVQHWHRYDDIKKWHDVRIVFPDKSERVVKLDALTIRYPLAMAGQAAAKAEAAVDQD